MTCNRRNPSDKCLMALDMKRRGYPTAKIRETINHDGHVGVWAQVRRLLPPDALASPECDYDCPLKCETLGE